LKTEISKEIYVEYIQTSDTKLQDMMKRSYCEARSYRKVSQGNYSEGLRETYYEDDTIILELFWKVITEDGILKLSVEVTK